MKKRLSFMVLTALLTFVTSVSSGSIWFEGWEIVPSGQYNHGDVFLGDSGCSWEVHELWDGWPRDGQNYLSISGDKKMKILVFIGDDASGTSWLQLMSSYIGYPLKNNTHIRFEGERHIEYDTNTSSYIFVLVWFKVPGGLWCDIMYVLQYNPAYTDFFTGREIFLGELSPIDRNIYKDFESIYGVGTAEGSKISDIRFCIHTSIWYGTPPFPTFTNWGQWDNIEIYNRERPVASFTYSPEKPMVGGNIKFDASSSDDPDGEIVKYKWDFGDGFIDTISGEVITHIYEHPDKYNVTLTVTDNEGLTDAIPKNLDLTLREGDLLLCRSPFSRVPGFWTHVGMYVGNEQVVEAVYEQEVKEVIISPLSQWNWPQKTCVEALSVVAADNEIRTRAVSFALSQVGKSYDSCLWEKNPNEDSWYCSELVWAAYFNASNGKINIEHGPDAVGITPTEIDLDNDTVLIGEHKERIPYAGPIIMMTKSPVDLNVTDPHGLFISKQLNQIPYTVYGEDDIDNNGSIDDWVGIPKPKIGEYLLNVVPEVNALPTDTYSLEATINGQTMVLAEDVQIQDIPSQPYKVEWKLCYSDFDVNGDVDFTDYAVFASHWMDADCNYPDWCEGIDLDYNGIVDFNDLTVFTSEWLWKKIPADIDFDGDVDFVDYATLALHWLDIGCNDPNWCGKADLNKSGDVNLPDLKIFSDHWLE